MKMANAPGSNNILEKFELYKKLKEHIFRCSVCMHKNDLSTFTCAYKIYVHDFLTVGLPLLAFIRFCALMQCIIIIIIKLSSISFIITTTTAFVAAGVVKGVVML